MAKSKDRAARSQGAPAAETPNGAGFTVSKRGLLLIAVVIIATVELFIVLGLNERYQITAYRRRAQKALAEQNYDTALKYYQKLLKIAPVSVPVNRETGDTYMGKGEFETAIRHYQTALSTDSSAKGINAKIGLAYVEMGRPNAAMPFFDKELALDPANEHALFYTAQRAFEAGRYLEAGAKIQALAKSDTYHERAGAIARQMEDAARAAVAGEPADETPTTTTPQ